MTKHHGTEPGWLLRHSNTKDYLIAKLKAVLATRNMDLAYEALAIAQALPENKEEKRV